MAHLRDVKVGQKVQIVEGKTPLEKFDAGYGFEKYIGCTTTVESVDPKDPFCTVQAGKEVDYFWFPVDWIKIIKDEKEQSVNTGNTTEEVKTKYAVLFGTTDQCISDYFEDINQVFEVIGRWQGFDQDEVVEFFEKGCCKIIEVKELDVKIEVLKPVIKIVG